MMYDFEAYSQELVLLWLINVNHFVLQVGWADVIQDSFFCQSLAFISKQTAHGKLIHYAQFDSSHVWIDYKRISFTNQLIQENVWKSFFIVFFWVTDRRLLE